MSQHDATELVIHAVRQTRNLNERIDALIEHARDLANALDECAAGPWRTDVENAPERGDMLLLWSSGYATVGCRMSPGKLWNKEGKSTDEQPIAFATINPPEITP